MSNEEVKMSLMPSQAINKPSTFDGNTSGPVYKMQFTMVSKANGWSHSAEAFHLAFSLRGGAADIFETFSGAQRHNFDSLLRALELRFSEKCTKEYGRLQLKSCYQKAAESLQELAMHIQNFLTFPFQTAWWRHVNI